MSFVNINSLFLDSHFLLLVFTFMCCMFSESNCISKTSFKTFSHLMLNYCNFLSQIIQLLVNSFFSDFLCYFYCLYDCLNHTFLSNCQYYSLYLSFCCFELFSKFYLIFVYQYQNLNYECNFMSF